MKRLYWLPLLIVFVCSSLSAHGQVGIYGGFSADSTSIPNDRWFYGATFGGYYTGWKVPFISVGMDGRASILHGTSSSSSQKIVNGLVGPRVQFHLPLVPLKPYAVGLLGASNLQIGQGAARLDQTVFSYGFAGGLDLSVFPFVDWRVAEYQFSRSNADNGIEQNTFTTGLVLHIPVP